MRISTLRKRCIVTAMSALGLQTVHAATVTIDPGTTYQAMDGFGASDNWIGSLTSAQLGKFFNKDTGIGLSILRMGTTNSVPLSTAGSWNTAKYAAQQGAILWAAPWSPPASMKSGGSTVGKSGGYLLPASYDAYATALANFATATKTNTGFNLYAISAENEPDYAYAITYDGCVYDPSQMAAFAKVLGPKLHALTPPVKLIAPESFSWKNLAKFADAIKADAGANSAVDIFATHDYEHGAQAYANPGRHIWETEVSGMSGLTYDIANGIQVANWIHNAIVVGGASAWHYWWLNNTFGGSDDEGLLTNGTETKRLYTMGNFSKFVRPGYVRVSATEKPANGITLTAYASPAGVSPAVFVVVAINASATAVNQSFSVTGATVSSVSPWLTDANNNLKKQADIVVNGSTFNASLGANSVTTLVLTKKTTGLDRVRAAQARVEHAGLRKVDASAVLSIGPSEQAGEAVLLDLQGREIQSRQIPSSSVDIEIPSLRSGSYILRIRRGDVSVSNVLTAP